MDYTDAALSYALLLIPLGFSGVMIAQGVSKIKKKEASGKTVLGMGIIFFLLVPAIYVLLTRV
jgi:VIT1/CCC1 family predicted Fe2+/Mn2+ transporter